MFQPQPTPFASSCFNSFGVPDFSYAPTPLTLQTASNVNGPSPHAGSGSVNSTHGAPHGARSHGGNSHSHSQHPHHSHHRQHPHHLTQSHSHHSQSLLYGASPSHSSTSSSASPVASSQRHFSPASHNFPSFPSHSSACSKMDQNDAQTQALQDELAAQEAAAREYQPQLEGPLVGEKMPCTAISNEYAKADPVYVEKTLALSHEYSHYRPIQGDGNCGWRAIGFSYFEMLIQGADRVQVETEIARITSLTQVLISVGYDQYLFEDMVEETIGLLKDICARLGNPPAAMATLIERFNNRDCSNAIIYHLRLLAGAWLKGDPTRYAGFIPQDLGVEGFCTDVIERVDREIENLGVILLVNALLEPVNFVLEIAYLDRSPGSEVNVYRFPEQASTQDVTALGPVIYLLYRPDHYDILYKGINIQVNNVTSLSHQADIQQQPLDTFSSTDYLVLSMLPNQITPTATGMSALESPAGAPPPVMPDSFMPDPPQAQGPWMQTQFNTMSAPPQGPPPPPAAAANSLAPPPPDTAPAASSPATTYMLRFSPQVYKLDNAAFPEPNFTTTMFKNSHFNKAHYNNPDFHPEEWTPDDDTPEKVAGSKKKSRGRHELHDGSGRA